ncbi:unnamed protein product [Hymenolepis diminuta]|uniref:Uncharacterized protein n=1 Tax=Hymenolepis diminuta TaxID=6216 RepID=A0A564XYB6_HYMDI|nr:unnamed protein product [Hymenolepis diminuta]
MNTSRLYVQYSLGRMIRQHNSRKTYQIVPSLFVRVDAVRKPLQSPYDGSLGDENPNTSSWIAVVRRTLTLPLNFLNLLSCSLIMYNFSLPQSNPHPKILLNLPHRFLARLDANSRTHCG